MLHSAVTKEGQNVTGDTARFPSALARLNV
jgi:hypothetical protein